jgi:hypothetical protein
LDNFRFRNFAATLNYPEIIAMIKYILLTGFMICLGGNPNVADKSIYFDIIHKDKVAGNLKATFSVCT